MCGIVGGVDVDVDHALKSIRHRGPDSNGLSSHLVGSRDGARRHVSLGHARLAIQDLTDAGHQPMMSRNGRWCVVFNGEIYNHLALRRPGSPYRGHSDTETLAELISDYGVLKAVELLNGMFAFGALDLVDGIIYLARDPFGIKPCYYHLNGSKFSFASEAKGLFAMGVSRELDLESLSEMLTLRFNPAPSTMWRDVRKVRPGHVLSYSLATSTLKSVHYRYQKPSEGLSKRNDPNPIKAYETQLSNAVERQLLADVPIGILLSGGIDSALVAAMAKGHGADLPCYSVGFGSGRVDCELEDAAETARILGLPFHPIIISGDELLYNVGRIASAIEEPIGTTSILAMWSLVQRARQDVPVVLTGQGTDELWGGYRKYQLELVRALLPRFPVPPTGSWLGNRFSGDSAVGRSLCSLGESDRARQIVAASSLFNEKELHQLTGGGISARAVRQVRSWIEMTQSSTLTPVEQMMNVDSRMSLADDLLLYGDKISMSFALELRVPMLDLDLDEYVRGIPIRQRVQIGRSKILHKAMAERYLPPRIVHRPKRGFRVPFSEWSRGIWRKNIEEMLFSCMPPAINVSVVESIWRDHIRGASRERQIFALFMLAHWNSANAC